MTETKSSLTVQTFAAARATLDAGGALEPAVAQGWEADQEAWLLELGAALDQGNVELLKAYETAYREAWSAKTQLEAAPIAMPKATPIAMRKPEEPDRPVPDVLPSDVSIDETAEISLASLGRSPLPFAGASAEPPTTPAAAIEHDNDQAGETSLGMPVVADETLPFGREAPTDASIDETGIIDNALLEQALRDGSLPFETDGASSVRASAADHEPRHPNAGATGFMPVVSFDDTDPAPVEPSPSRPAPATGVNIDQTAFMDAIVIDDDPLPFDAAAAGGGGTPTPVTAAMPPHAQTGGTRRVEVSATPVGSVMPFQPVTSMGTITIGHLTLQQLAALEVEVANGIGRIPEILTAFHLDPTTYRALRSELLERCKTPQVKRFYEQERDAYARWRAQRDRGTDEQSP